LGTTKRGKVGPGKRDDKGTAEKAAKKRYRGDGLVTFAGWPPSAKKGGGGNLGPEPKKGKESKKGGETTPQPLGKNPPGWNIPGKMSHGGRKVLEKN